jgi:hypothetical protein
MTSCWFKKTGTGGNAASFATDAFTRIQELLVRMQSAFLASINVLPVANGHQHSHGSEKFAKLPIFLGARAI